MSSNLDLFEPVGNLGEVGREDSQDLDTSYVQNLIDERRYFDLGFYLENGEMSDEEKEIFLTRSKEYLEARLIQLYYYELAINFLATQDVDKAKEVTSINRRPR